jgi:hypothetical protein
MNGKKKEKLSLKGGQLISSGDVVRVMEQGAPVNCRVVSCIAAPDGTCHASLEVLEGPKAGQRISAKLKAGGPEPADTSGPDTNPS